MNRSCFEALAVTASVPFRSAISGAELRLVFETGHVPQRFRPHLGRALNEAPLEMIDRVVCQFAPADGMLERLSRIAAAVGACERIGAWLRG